MEPQVFVVMGETGEYSDRTEWPVVAFFNEGAAQERVLALEAWCREHKVSMASVDFRNPRKSLVCPLDSCFQVSYTGTRYCVMVVPLATP